MPYPTLTFWRRGGALLVLAGAAVAALPSGRVHAQAAIAEPAGPALPVPPAAPPAPSPHTSADGAQRTRVSSITTVSEDLRHASVLLEAGNATVYGSGDDLREARRVRHGEETLWWIRRDDKRYVVRDAATIQRMKAAHAPVEALGRQQAALGEQQGVLGQRQGELGAQQGELARRQASLAREDASLARERARQADRGAQAAATARRDAAYADYAQQMAALGERQAAFAMQQEGFAQRQGALAQRQQAANVALRRDLDRIVEQAIAQGVAQPLPR